MSVKEFTGEEIEELKKNPYVKNVSEKGITYTDEFKRIFIAETEKGKSSGVIFRECGFDTAMLGKDRYVSASIRWRKAYKSQGIDGITDSRTINSGRTLKRELSMEEKYERLEIQNKVLKAENELLKKIEVAERRVDKKQIELSAEKRYLMIKVLIEKYHLKNKTSYLCEAAGVSRSGYYNYFSEKSQKTRKVRNEKDELLRVNIMNAFEFKGRKKGARQIKMTLSKHFKTVYNLKRIRRIMKKYNIFCPIRKANPYRRMMKATLEHTVVPNILNREFKQEQPGKVLLTDITYLFYGNGEKAYLSTIKDSATNEILTYQLSKNITLDIVLETVNKLMENKEIKLHEEAFIHSDQGSHYTSPIFQKLVKKHGLGQSMSRRGNCWDNAPQESFFGHFKDEAYIKQCESYDDLGKEIDDYMSYYNYFRGQWNLKKMTPVKYRNHLLMSA